MFKNINSLLNTKQKKFFVEKANLYVKLIKVFAQKNDLIDPSINETVTDFTLNRLFELEIIDLDKPEDQKLLKKILKNELFNEFILAVNYSIKYQDRLGDLLDKLDPVKRKEIQENSQLTSGPRTVDFFCGAGGLSLGFCQEGFKIDLANDYEDVCVETFRYNHPEVSEDRVILGDIRNIVDHIENFVDKDIDVVIGGPPCQGFSSANQQRIIDDPRNELYKYYLKAIEKIAPKFVVMENVRGMLPYAQQVVDDYKNIKTTRGDRQYTYLVGCEVLVSDNFGVAQKRQRLIFIAIRDDIAANRKISPSDLFKEIKSSYEGQKSHVLKDALEFIKPLDAPRIKNMTEVDDEITGKKVDVNQFKGDENTYLELINEGRQIDYVFNHKARYTNDINYEIYGTLDQGEDGTSEKIKHVMPYKHRNHIFKDKYFKLVEDKPSRTITAHLKMDCHSHIHPRQVRSITPREAARIQSFPDDYVFLGAYLKTYMQIGNAVPPIMARRIAMIIKKYI